ncbi:MAG TPA: VCBS repeat-containing protein, partial [Planctomycetaceae bacterium]
MPTDSPTTAAAGRPCAPPTPVTSQTLPRSGIRFEIADAGIDFRYFHSADPATPGARMFEFTGGGVGVLDYDADGRPDLHFTQGCRWPPDPRQREYLDRIFRNLGSRFADVTVAAGVVEPAFSQGVACGDFDGDGFPDLYVANIGANRLFRNNGDGTFRDVTQDSGVLVGPLAEAWTTSAVMADLNGDGLPDLFDVNYVEGSDVFERICDHDGVPRVCSPTAFDAQPDRLLLNRGDGAFTDVTAIAGIGAPDGTGLGVVAADFDGSGRLSLFVANDARNNHFYANAAESPGGLPRFEERAAVNGTAFDRDGRSQACMGVAAGDADGDGRLDLFVTNYVAESNTLYLQEPDGVFVDASRAAGLSEPSLDLLG